MVFLVTVFLFPVTDEGAAFHVEISTVMSHYDNAKY